VPDRRKLRPERLRDRPLRPTLHRRCCGTFPQCWIWLGTLGH
jgi:hypothetical protein